MDVILAINQPSQMPVTIAETHCRVDHQRTQPVTCRGADIRLSQRSEAKKQVLIVDDDEFVRETMADLLELAGFHSLRANSAAGALVELRQNNFIDALITDLSMPGDDGIALIRQARELKPGLPAILLTGYAEQIASVSTIAGGHFHVLRKPVECNRLIEQLRLLMNQGAHP